MLEAPFPWFGGKSRAADLIWERFGDVPNYVEPFAGSLAVLLQRPHKARLETVNDKDAFLVNFWRAVRYDPDGVAHWAEWPISEVDLNARHHWLVSEGRAIVARCYDDPAFFDRQVAGWWVWGLCQWIGSGWCGEKAGRQLPDLYNHGRGLLRLEFRDDIPELLLGLQKRLRRVRIAAGDWKRVLSPSVTYKATGTNLLTGVLLDPPYDDGELTYAAGGQGISGEVRAWAVANGDNPLFRIALCGYEGEHPMPDTWRCVPWKANGGYGSQGQGKGRDNASRERIWFSPHCIDPAKRVPTLFDGLTG